MDIYEYCSKIIDGIVNDIINVEDDYYIYKFNEGQIFSKIYKRNIGFLGKNGYYQFKDYNDGKRKLVHRVLYQKYHGIKLEKNQQIDHINRIKTDNRIDNLRVCSHQQNILNKTHDRDNQLKQKNISINTYYRKSGKIDQYYYIQIKRNNKVIYQKYLNINDYSLDDAIKIRDDWYFQNPNIFHAI